MEKARMLMKPAQEALGLRATRSSQHKVLRSADIGQSSTVYLDCTSGIQVPSMDRENYHGHNNHSARLSIRVLLVS
jgi:hypothetical protein